MAKKKILLLLFCFLINTFIQQRCIKLIKSDIKDVYNVANDIVINNCCSLAHVISFFKSHFNKTIHGEN